jgi:hypothetical protein
MPELGGAKSRHARLIDEAAEAPLQLPKNRKMVFQLGEALFAGEKSAFKIHKLGAASRVELVILDMGAQRHH